MSIGLGLFLGLVFCSVIFLYTQTKDRWNWSKGGKIFLYLIGTPFVIMLFFLGGNYFYEEYQERPKVITELKGVYLGENFQDVIFKHGNAKRILWFWADDSPDTTPYTDDEVKTQLRNAGSDLLKQIAEGSTDGYYVFDKDTLTVTIKNNRVEKILVGCTDGGNSLNGISCGSNGDEILNKFGRDIRVLCNVTADPDKNSLRVYEIVKYGTRYYLRLNTVNQMMITSPATLNSYVSKKWAECS